MIEKDKYYVNRHTIGPYHVYLALEDAEEVDDLIKVIDLTIDKTTYIQSKNVFEVDVANIDKEYLDIANKYLH